MITVYYDGKCGLCSKEIAYYKRIAPPDTFLWLDVFENKDEIEAEGLVFADVLKFFHVKDSANKFHIGINGFILIWGQLKYWSFLAKLSSFPLINFFLQKIYFIFAKWRFSNLGYCNYEPK